MTSEEYKKFEEDFNKQQDEKYQKKSDRLEKEFPLQERIMAVEQMKANEKLKKEAEAKEQEMEVAEELIDTSQFKPISTTELIKILGLTIKRDEINKLLTFLAELSAYTEDLSRKILIFLDQPHTMLLQHLRPMLSHDKKEIRLKITDKSQKAGLKTKNIYLKGFPTVIFCTAGLNLDEQEAT